MPIQATIKRYLLVYNKIKAKYYPSMRSLLCYLREEGFQLSERTLKRDIVQLRDEFGIDILYDSSRKGYYIGEENIAGQDRFIRLLEIMTTAGIITDTLKKGREALQYLSFEGSTGLAGIQFLDKALTAIRQQHIITFRHQNFDSTRVRNVTLQPYLLKEYRQRWYVVGLSANRNTFTIYGLDRISDLTVTDEHFTRNKEPDPASLFDSIIGINYDEHQEQEVILSFTPQQGKYIKALPVHSSQKILLDDDHELRIGLYLRPNFELKQLLLSYGATVKIMEPKWLKTDIVAIYKMALEQY